ncbi:MAG TPA: hypothetical protein VFM51_10600 [Solirubrobacterales bacterium]|nr:hypothetical protein [Solirubrobacterales bacterium]
MRPISILLALLLLATLGLAASARGAQLPVPGEVTSLLPLAGEIEEEDEEAEETEEGEAEEEEICEPDPELEEFCEEESPGLGKGECLLKKASATVTANPGKRRLRLSVHYRTLEPATVVVETSLRGSKGFLHLGSDHARFRRSGVYRDTFALPERKMKKALAARDFRVELHVVGTPPSCRVELSAHRNGARKLSWS